MRRHVWIANLGSVVLAALACHVRTGASASSEPLRLDADSAVYTVRFVDEWYQANIGFHFTNHSRDTLSENYCREPTPPELEKHLTDGSWKLAFAPFLWSCLTMPPLRIVPGGSYHGTTYLSAVPKGTKNRGPALAVDSVRGTYRLRWALKRGSNPDDRKAAVLLIFSPPFHLIVR